MSYILEALKRSQRERALGRVPTLGSALPLDPEPPPANPWLVTSLGLALVAVLLGLYAAFGQRWFPGPEPVPPGPAETQVQPTPATPAIPVPPTPSVVAASPVPPSPAPAPTPLPAGLAATAGAAPLEPGPPPVALLPAVEPELPLDLSHVEVAPRESTPTPTPAPIPAPTMADKPPSIPEELRLQVEAFKRQVRKEDAATPSRPPVGPPTPVARAAPPEAEPPASPGAPARPTPGDASQLPERVQDRLPPRQLTVHVFAETPARRFVILNGQRLKEGQRAPDGLLLKEIRPDGVILDYEGHGFFLSRAVKGGSRAPPNQPQ